MIFRLTYVTRRSVNALSLAVLVCFGACSIIPNPFSRTPSPGSSEGEQRTSPDDLSREEIFRDGEADPTAYELVQRLRPNWLRARGQVSLGSPEAAYALVYMNDVLFGNLMTLHQIPPSQIERMEFVRSIDATIRWGTGHTAGVINIVTGR